MSGAQLAVSLRFVAIVLSITRTRQDFRTTPELIVQHGYSAESHSVLTQDGHLLTVHRLLPRSADGPSHTEYDSDSEVTSALDRPIVFLQHGVLASSLDWVLTGPDKALGYKLCDAGYDVWMGNLRGNLYSKKHINMTAEEPEFWNFSWHEIGMYDLPAMVDRVLAVTGQPGLHLLGHSMGATVTLVMLTERPEYNSKLQLTVLLAPVVRLMYNTSVFRYSAPYWRTFQRVTQYAGVHSFPPSSQRVQEQLAPMCAERYVGARICARFLHTVAGYTRHLNMSLVPDLFSHYPTQTSVRTMSHFMQSMDTGRFSKYDYGPEENTYRYNSSSPVEYDLVAVSSPVAIFVGDSDPFTEPQDMEWLAQQLPNMIGNFLVAAQSFSHLSFLWSTDADAVLYDPLLRLLDMYRVY
ncbi:lipase 3 [Anabrus simplex]|uniref:lipase 3 n=1 Tax=Anabrus simplex TaxID=316456 RepID=UPI0035A355BC